MAKMIPTGVLNTSMSLIYPEESMGCTIQGKPPPCTIPTDFDLFYELLNTFMQIIGKALSNYDLPAKSIDCENPTGDLTNETKLAFHSELHKEIDKVGNDFMFDDVTQLMKINFYVGIKVMESTEIARKVATWSTNEGITVEPDEVIPVTRLFYRIGTAEVSLATKFNSVLRSPIQLLLYDTQLGNLSPPPTLDPF